MKKKLLVLFALLLSLLMVFVACGDKDDDGDESSEDPTEEYFSVSFELGYEGAQALEGKEVKYGSKIGTLPTPARLGWVFEGWYDEDGTKYTSAKKVTEDLVLTAKWSEEPPCDHSVGFTTVGYVEVSCEENQVLTQRCRNPRCGFIKEVQLSEKQGHDLSVKKEPATCVDQGIIITKCKRENCDYRVEEKDPDAPATGIHKWGSWVVTKAQTDYAYGEQRRGCPTCGALEYLDINPNKLDEYDSLPIKNVNIAGQTYVNVVKTATAQATSLYRLTSASNVLDGAPGTYWRADTLVERTSYIGDELEVTLATSFIVGQLEFVLPNYYGWALGDSCTVKYKVELLVDNAWVEVGTISDSDNADPKSKNVTVSLPLAQVYTTNKVKLTVIQASRYTPPMVCDINVYGQTDASNVVRVPKSLAPLATGFITGSYNAYVNSSAANLLDGNRDSSWCTDARVWTDVSVQKYGRSTLDITNWDVDYDDISTPTVLESKKITKVVVNASELVGQCISASVCQPTAIMVDKTQGVVDANGNPVYIVEQVENENGILVDKVDENGNPVYKVDKNGNPIQKTEVVMEQQKDQDGNLVYEVDANGEQVKDANGNPIPVMVPVKVQKTDENGKLQWNYVWTNLVLSGVTDEDGKAVTTAIMTAGGPTTFEFVAPQVTVDKNTTSMALDNVISVRVDVDNYGVDEDKDRTTVSSVIVTENGADKTYDNLDWTLRKKVYASFSFPQAEYVAYLEIMCDVTIGRVMSVQFWVEDSNYEKGGYWTEFTRCTVGADVVGQRAMFTMDVNQKITQMRVEVTVEPARWGAYIYEVAPYTVEETATELPKLPGICLHKFAKTDPIEIVAPTCTTPGYTVYECLTCSLRWKTDAVDMTGHTWKTFGSQTADANGNKIQRYKCDCGASKTNILEYNVSGTFISVPTPTKYYHNAPASWTMTFDDGNYIETYEWVMPHFVERNITATAVVALGMGGSYTNEWAKYIKSGAFDLGSHSTAHGSGFNEKELNEAYLISEIDDAFFTLMSWVPGQRVIGFATPFGATSSHTANFVNDLMIGGRSGGQAGDYCDPDTLKTRADWGNLPSYIGGAETTFGVDGRGYGRNNSSFVGLDYKSAIDHLVEGGLWTVECLHTIDTTGKMGQTDKFAVNTEVFLKKLDYLESNGVWVSSYTQALQYLKESHVAEVKDMTITDTTITLSVTDGLDDIMFNFPLTFQMTLPTGWTNVTVTQNGVAIPVVSNADYKPNMALDMACTIEGGVLYFDAVPDGGQVVITKAN